MVPRELVISFQHYCHGRPGPCRRHLNQLSGKDVIRHHDGSYDAPEDKAWHSTLNKSNLKQLEFSPARALKGRNYSSVAWPGLRCRHLLILFPAQLLRAG
jgi:hypothetical protein